MISASAPLTLVSINIEGRRHLDTVLAFLLGIDSGRGADVICLQEVFESDLEDIARALGMKSVFAPMTLLQVDKKTGPH
ncbi:MAG: endonuclease/exonuclease/phosphatase family protein, partial [Candidatus Harrisonbacteria bacterium]|nr:endonuclease/exonuclease/phosphatase family protein [Candidatus Harrisonbacteria bacterium]